MTRAVSGIVKANPKYILQVSVFPTIPNGFSEAVKDHRLKDAMDSEIDT